MKCSLCGCEFDEQAARKSCAACGLLGNCKLIKCPRCGYETPQEPRLITTIRNWWRLRRTHARSAR